jgi:hypothetical protein
VVEEALTTQARQQEKMAGLVEAALMVARVELELVDKEIMVVLGFLVPYLQLAAVVGAARERSDLTLHLH